MDATYKPVMTQEFRKALEAMRSSRPFSRLTQKQAEAVVAVLASREEVGEGSRFGWSFATEMDDFTKILPFAVSAFVCIDRDCDEIVSQEEYDAWLQAPELEHRVEISRWSSAAVPDVEESLAAYSKRGLDSPQDGLVWLLRAIFQRHFDQDKGMRNSLNLRDFVHAVMGVVVEARKQKTQAAVSGEPFEGLGNPSAATAATALVA
eukprot:TRINITY_DN45567_c0_g1_i1.p1 TRINITY_DN45567_c0_g1~~TRINITY_DN45567_c0_g1_i1.p1  ORF type:complete len:229 (+),score=70.32 TRINITY_DN45567_c0_g1_i1:71-688(+)